jgi:hypothetical protein
MSMQGLTWPPAACWCCECIWPVAVSHRTRCRAVLAIKIVASLFFALGNNAGHFLTTWAFWVMIVLYLVAKVAGARCLEDAVQWRLAIRFMRIEKGSNTVLRRTQWVTLYEGWAVVTLCSICVVSIVLGESGSLSELRWPLFAGGLALSYASVWVLRSRFFRPRFFQSAFGAADQATGRSVAVTPVDDTESYRSMGSEASADSTPVRAKSFESHFRRTDVSPLILHAVLGSGGMVVGLTRLYRLRQIEANIEDSRAPLRRASAH